VLEVVQAHPDLVDDPRLPGPELLALPEARALPEEGPPHLGRLRGRQVLELEAEEEGLDPPKPLEDRPASGLRRMGREDELDVQRSEEGTCRPCVESTVLQAAKGRL